MIDRHTIIQIIPGKTNPSFDGCLAIVDSVHEWGVRAYVLSPQEFGPRQWFIKLTYEMFRDLIVKAEFQ